MRRYRDATMLGENLAALSGAADPAAMVVRMWMDSPGHREIMLTAGFRRIGVAARTGTARRGPHDGGHGGLRQPSLNTGRVGSAVVVRRDLSHPVVPTLAAAVLGAAYLVAAPETADMAAHTYRTWLWHQVGFATWNAQWYGGHHMAGYSLLYPPLAALAGTRLVGVVAGVAAVWLFAVLARRIAADARRPARSPPGSSSPGS